MTGSRPVLTATTPGLHAPRPSRVPDPGSTTGGGWRAGVARTVLHNLVRGWKGSRLTIVDHDGTGTFGPADGRARAVTVHDPRTYELVLRQGSRGLGRSYVEGWWSTDDLAGFLVDAHASTERLSSVGNLVPAPVRRLLGPEAPGADPDRDRRNVRAHYDLSNDFFGLFLDDTMTYSCALFSSAAADLEQAQVAKLDLMCRRLGLGPGDHVMEIGTGWGSFAVHAAGRYGCRVTTTTVSADQYELARRRVCEAGLAGRVEVFDVDYRDLRGTYDAVASIEMIEAVGWRDHATFLDRCARLLRPAGRLGLQAILIDDAHYERAKHRRDFIKEYVFPGGCLPSDARLAEVAAATGLEIVDRDDLSAHYDRTLQCWADRLAANSHRLADIGADDRLRRLWEFYLAYCQAGFRRGHIGVAQFTLEGQAGSGRTRTTTLPTASRSSSRR